MLGLAEVECSATLVVTNAGVGPAREQHAHALRSAANTSARILLCRVARFSGQAVTLAAVISGVSSSSG
ncbi:MAG: hypothetical protein M3071_17010 [Actinomycetota bacterium]|nr:hypothetical protein [Actinomycetota bacterium]